MNYNDEKKYVGNIDQLFKCVSFRMLNGKADNVKMLDVNNGSGLNFNVNLDRGMDIPYLSYKGSNIGYISPCGVVAPQYFDDKELGFLKSFTAGFLTTCGLLNVGTPGEYKGRHYGLHGNVSHLPAINYSYDILQEEGKEPYLEIKGRVEEAAIFGERMSLNRTIHCSYKDKKIHIYDTVKNNGFTKSQHMILYHINIGYPFLCEDSEIFMPSMEVRPRTKHSREGMDDWDKLESPQDNYEEMCFYHKLKSDTNNMATVKIFNPRINMGIAIDIDTTTLDHFVQWKMMGKGDYVTGLEPCNCTIDGVEDAYNNGQIKFLEPDEEVHYHLTVRIIDGKENL